ncbi:histidine phosphatase family protein [Labedaea rhizosphaerae]|uniref:Putative phosphoglycerate mutase n=1 Tax=Labedaea rhizosphaerae TaxID=598644 RepID=A0A4R6S7D7_LABRH|nr:histidine phosphatase family protein [Labedaea rhizosphaerae]TDP95157.1 putative phosphoglycerate mutase [Labedaea rhizosphaerae]
MSAEVEEYPQVRFQAPPGSATLLLFRHGASAPVRPGVPIPDVDGQDDPNLAPEGEEQAEQLAARFGGEHFDAIYVSTLRRTAQTAAPLAKACGLTPIVEPDLREVFLGEWEGGGFRRHVSERHPIAIKMYAEQRWDVIPGAEPGERFAARVQGVVSRIADRHAGERVAVFSHGGVIGAALAWTTGSRPFAFSVVDNGSVSELVNAPWGWVLRRFNDTAHLD